MQDAKRRAIIFVVIALLLAGIAGLLFMQQVSSATGGNTTTVYVAKSDIPSRQPLKKEHFEKKDVPTKYVQDTTVTDLEQIQMGKYRFKINQLVSVVPIPEGGILTTNMLKEQSALTANNKRMVSIAKSDRIVFDGNFDFNDRVDIIVSTRGKGAPKTETFMRDVQVVGVSKNKKGTVNGLGLEMTLDDAEKFIHMQNFAASIRILKAPTEKADAGNSGGTNKPQTVPARTDTPANEEPPSKDPRQADSEEEVVDPSSP